MTIMNFPKSSFKVNLHAMFTLGNLPSYFLAFLSYDIVEFQRIIEKSDYQVLECLPEVS